ncbi:hypothetical protein LCGC14_0396700 [marine sediment metagenome]|uniref:Uncharacterized protein n=1 Tax=marine sediment metagenome TaxID=412755 RepID=A0A0F9W772_9ZZZZ
MSEKEAEVEETATEPNGEVQEEATKTFAQEDVDAIVAEKNKRIKDLENQNKGLSKLQSEATLDAERLRSQPQSSGVAEALEAVLKAMPQQTDIDGRPVINPEIAKAQARLNFLKQQERQKQQVAYATGERQKMRQEAEEAGIDPDGDELALVELAWDNNNPAVARKWLDKAKKKHLKTEPAKETKVTKTEEEIRAEVTSELTAKYKIQDTISPSGVNVSFTETERKYAEGEISFTEYSAARKKQNL